MNICPVFLVPFQFLPLLGSDALAFPMIMIYLSRNVFGFRLSFWGFFCSFVFLVDWLVVFSHRSC